MKTFTKEQLVVVVLTLHCISAPLLVTAQSSQQSKLNVISTKIPLSNSFLYSAPLTPFSSNEDDDKSLKNRNIRIINLGTIVNSENEDYAPNISADGKILYFVSNREGSALNFKKEPSHDLWAAKKNNELDTVFFKPFNIDTTTTYGNLGVNTQLNEGTTSISADGKTLIFTGCNRVDGYGDCDLYITEIVNGTWQKPFNLGRNVNSDYWEAQPTITADKSRIYFCSDRPCPNGYNNSDIWYTDYDFDNGEWKAAVNAGSTINTKGRESSPFITADGKTLFFASDGQKPNLGDQDFYLTRWDGKAWSKPENLGEPINTAEREEFISLSASGRVLYFSSIRKDYKGNQGKLDIFMAFYPDFSIIFDITSP
jgi:Tol biopolymer transport system component